MVQLFHGLVVREPRDGLGRCCEVLEHEPGFWPQLVRDIRNDECNAHGGTHSRILPREVGVVHGDEPDDGSHEERRHVDKETLAYNPFEN